MEQQQKNILSMQMSAKTGAPAWKHAASATKPVTSIAHALRVSIPWCGARARLDELLCRGHALLKCSVRLSGCAGDTDERVDGLVRVLDVRNIP